jgi:hypothetical protein
MLTHDDKGRKPLSQNVNTCPKIGLGSGQVSHRALPSEARETVLRRGRPTLERPHLSEHPPGVHISCSWLRLTSAASPYRA